MSVLTRRDILKTFFSAAVTTVSAAAVTACQTRLIEIDQGESLQNHVTPTATDVHGETASASELPQTVSPVSEHVLPTPFPAPPTSIELRADVLNYGWTRFAQKAASDFTETFPHITIQWRSLSDWRVYPQRIAVLRAAGDLGDLIESPSATLTTAWAREELVTDLAEWIEAADYDTSGIFPSGLAAFRWQERQVGLPLLCHGGDHILVFDHALFDNAGVSHPDETWSLDDLERAAERLTLPQQGIYGHLVAGKLPGAYPFLRAFGATVLNETGTACTIDEDSGQSWLNWVYRQIHELGIAPAPASIERSPTAMWQSGRLAMMRTSLRHAVTLMQLGPDRPLGAIPLPSAPETDNVPALATGVAYCIPATSPHAAEAFEWITFMLDSAMGIKMFLEGLGEPGSQMSSWQDTHVLQRFPHCAQLVDTVARAAPERLPNNLRTEACYRVWNAEVAAMLSGDQSLDETSKAIVSAINEILDTPEQTLDEQM